MNSASGPDREQFLRDGIPHELIVRVTQDAHAARARALAGAAWLLFRRIGLVSQRAAQAGWHLATAGR
jgi:hypothetical protein